ncbi:MAG: hypothetical protein JKY31_13190 [Rhodobacteraceae bacterium]|nr:hypothetical protein [Paracoccaceae bacterium]
MSKNRERVLLQAWIDKQKITNAQELLSYIADKGWTISRTNKRSEDDLPMLGVRIQPGKVFRVHFDFDNSSIKPKPRRGPAFFPDENIHSEGAQRGYWVYGLIAETYGSKACYIGQTTRCLSRFRNHLKRSRIGKGSTGLFEWADSHETTVLVVLLDYVPNLSGKSETAKQATILEGTWLKRAIKCGYETPLIENWGQLPFDPHALKTGWPTEEIDRLAIPAEDAVVNLPNITSFAISSLVQTIEKIGTSNS